MPIDAEFETRLVSAHNNRVQWRKSANDWKAVADDIAPHDPKLAQYAAEMARAQYNYITRIEVLIRTIALEKLDERVDDVEELMAKVFAPKKVEKNKDEG